MLHFAGCCEERSLEAEQTLECVLLSLVLVPGTFCVIIGVGACGRLAGYSEGLPMSGKKENQRGA